MKVTPQITADLEEYPELAKLLNAVIRPVVDLMGAHAIASLRRMRKTGVFDHPYDKDVITPMGIPVVPESVMAVQYMAGKAMLDYLAAIGVSGITLEMTQEEMQAIANMWAPRKAPPDKPPQQKEDDGLNPTPVDGEGQEEEAQPEKQDEQPTKEERAEQKDCERPTPKKNPEQNDDTETKEPDDGGRTTEG